MKIIKVALLFVCTFLLSSCGNTEENPDNQTYYQVVSEMGEATYLNYEIIVYDAFDKSTKGTNDYPSHYFNDNQPYAVSFFEGVAYLHQIDTSNSSYIKQMTGGQYECYYSSVLKESCDYSFINNHFVGRNFSNESTYFKNYSINFEKGKVVFQRPYSQDSSMMFVTESYAKSNNISIVKIS